MGVCGGSATSGHGLTDHQVQCALRRVVNDILDEWNAETEDQQGDTTLCAEDFSAKKVHICTAEGRDGGETIKVTEFAPKVFRTIRTLSGVKEDQFAAEWDLSGSLDMQLGAGRSNALFFPSKNRLFLCKTIADHEVEVLDHILPPYIQHLRQFPGTFLTRFFLMMKVEVNGEQGLISCFHDVCAKAPRIHEKWDIKGRKPKPGKYAYYPTSVPFDSDVPMQVFECDEDVTREPADHESDEDMAHSPVQPMTRKNVKNAETAHGTSVKVRKDKDLNRLFWLMASERTAVVKQLHNDYEFLGKRGLMDYSLFVAVCRTDNGFNANQLSTMFRVRQAEGDAVEERQGDAVSPTGDGPIMPVSSTGSTTNPFVAQTYSRPIPSFRSQEVYYIGIIDMLTEYTYKKKLAHFFKSFLWTSETLSTITPDKYKKRLERFSRAIFPRTLAPLSVPMPDAEAEAAQEDLQFP